jgi:predicted glycoside hydrolase/deacetylase ChbG (UPF0249 family)
MENTKIVIPMSETHLQAQFEQKSLTPRNDYSLAAIPNGEPTQTGALIINADDWGRSRETTDRIFDCFRAQAMSSVSAMVFMEDSERSAQMALEHGIDAGLHLNFTGPYTGPNCSPQLLEHQRSVAKYLMRNPLARGLFNPWLARSFEYLVAAQIEEYVRLFGEEPKRLDGHHHMHLSANVLFGGLLPPGKIVRRHFSYESGEKVARNRVFRWFTDSRLKGRFRFADFLFTLPPLDPPARLQKIFSLAGRSFVEVETHPVNPDEFRFLTAGEIFRWTGNCQIANHFAAFTSTAARGDS